MFLSRVELNPYRRETIRALSSPQMMHAAVMASFGSFDNADGDRPLWRIDRLGPATYILVQSRKRPDFSHIVEQFGRPESDRPWETVDYDGFLSGLSDGESLRFRLRANPTRSVSSLGENGRGKVVAHVTANQQREWLIQKSHGLGFVLEDGTRDGSFDIVSRESVRFRHGGGSISLGVATFEGVLKVADADVFRETLCNGIGRAKAYGCGLMTVLRP